MDKSHSLISLILLDVILLISVSRSEPQCPSNQEPIWSPVYANRKVSAHNMESFNGKSVAECKALCMATTTSTSAYTCRSIEIRQSNNECVLQDVGGLTLTTPQSGWDYYYVQCTAKTTVPVQVVTIPNGNTPDPNGTPVFNTPTATPPPLEPTPTPPPIDVETPSSDVDVVCTFRVNKGGSSLPTGGSSVRNSLRNQIADEFNLARSRVTVSSADKNNGRVTFKTVDSPTSDPRSCTAMHEFRAALDTWQIDWGNKHNRNLISDSLECELCSFTDAPTTPPLPTTPPVMIVQAGEFRITKPSGNLPTVTTTVRNSLRNQIKNMARPGISNDQVTIVLADKTTGFISFTIAHHYEHAEVTACQGIQHMIPRIATERIDWGSKTNRAIIQDSWVYDVECTPAPTSPPPPSTPAPPTTPPPITTTPAEVKIQGWFTVSKSNNRMPNPSISSLKSQIKTLMRPGVTSNQIVIMEANRNTGHLIFSHTQIIGTHDVSGCKAMMQMTPRISSARINWGTYRNRPIREGTFGYSLRCDIAVQSDDHQASFSILNPATGLGGTDDILRSLSSQLADMAALVEPINRIRVQATQYNTSNALVMFHVSEQPFHDLSSCDILLLIHIQLSAGATVTMGDHNYAMVENSMTIPNHCTVEEKVVDVIIRFGELTFGSEYQDKFSEEYFQLKNIVEDFLQSTLGDGSLAGYLNSIEVDQFLPGSVVADAKVYLDGTAPGNVPKTVGDETNAQLTKDGGMIGGHKADPILTADSNPPVTSTITPGEFGAKKEDDLILGLETHWIVIIGLGIVAVLLVCITIVAVFTFKLRRDNQDKSPLNEEEPEDKEERQEKEHKKRRKLFGRKKKEKDQQENEYTEPEDMDEHAHNNFSDANGEGGLPY